MIPELFFKFLGNRETEEISHKDKSPTKSPSKTSPQHRSKQSSPRKSIAKTSPEHRRVEHGTGNILNNFRVSKFIFCTYELGK